MDKYEEIIKKVNEEADYVLRLPMKSLEIGFDRLRTAKSIGYAEIELGYITEKLEKINSTFKYIKELFNRLESGEF
jgi:hypothetical protein